VVAGGQGFRPPITGARHSVDLTMYELADPTAEADLAADAGRGVDVRVLLDRHLEKSRNTSAYNYLNAHGVHVRWAPAGTARRLTLRTTATSACSPVTPVTSSGPDSPCPVRLKLRPARAPRRAACRHIYPERTVVLAPVIKLPSSAPL
jgi:PLD-like domain